MSGRELKEKILKNAIHTAILENKSVIDQKIMEKVLSNVDTKKNPMFI